MKEYDVERDAQGWDPEGAVLKWMKEEAHAKVFLEQVGKHPAYQRTLGETNGRFVDPKTNPALDPSKVLTVYNRIINNMAKVAGTGTCTPTCGAGSHSPEDELSPEEMIKKSAKQKQGTTLNLSLLKNKWKRKAGLSFKALRPTQK